LAATAVEKQGPAPLGNHSECRRQVCRQRPFFNHCILKGNDMSAKTGGATEGDALASAAEATQAGLDGAVQANEARALGAKLSAAKTEATESAKGI
jgi:hypothetical protein